MKSAENVVETETNYTFDEKVTMTFAEEANALLLGNLIKQYSNPYLAALREYTSNARDSHREAGITRPIEVTLPNQYSPALIIEDFGLGLTREQLKGYGQFGKSSKRDSNDYTGGFGLGSKSALAMSAQFTVTAVKDGKRNTVIIHRAENGAPVMGFPFPEQDAPGVPNGVKVTIPTSEASRFEQAISNGFFLGWEPGTILINGAEPTTPTVYDTDLFVPIGDGLGWELKRLNNRESGTLHLRQATVLINGVRYTLDYSELREFVSISILEEYLSRAVIDLENGEVEIHPSRETLIYDKRTREYIQKRIEQFVDHASAQLQTDIDGAKNLREALAIRSHARKVGFQNRYTYRNISLDSNKLFTPGPDVNPMVANFNRSVYNGDKAARNYMTEEAIANELIRSSFSDTKILVVGAERNIENGNYLRQSATASQFVRAMQKKGRLRGTTATVYYTTHKKRRLNGHFKQLFSMVIDADSYDLIVSNFRKELLAIARKNSVKTGSLAGTVKVSMSGAAYKDINIDDLDPEATHVLIHAEQDSFVRDIYNMLGPRYSHDSTVQSLIRIANYASMGKIAYVLIPASRKTTRLVKVIPNLIENPYDFFNMAIEKFIKSIDARHLTTLQKYTRPSYNSATAFNYRSHLMESILDKPGAEKFSKMYRKAMDNLHTLTRAESVSGFSELSYLIDVRDRFEDKIPALNTLPSETEKTVIGAKLMSRYPLLRHIAISHWELKDNPDILDSVIQYVQMVDKTTG